MVSESEIRWAEHFIKHAELASTKSKDRSTKVGAIIVGPDNEVRSMGFNGFPRAVNDDVDSRHERPDKYLYTEHAERNAILNAVRAGISTKGCRLVLNCAPTPCADCARAIIQAGIIEVIGTDIPFAGKGEQWEAHMKASSIMLEEAGVKVTRV